MKVNGNNGSDGKEWKKKEQEDCKRKLCVATHNITVLCFIPVLYNVYVDDKCYIYVCAYATSRRNCKMQYFSLKLHSMMNRWDNLLFISFYFIRSMYETFSLDYSLQFKTKMRIKKKVNTFS